MKFLKEPGAIQDADSGEDRAEPAMLLERQASDLRLQLGDAPAGSPARAELLIELGRILLRLEHMPEVWQTAQEAFEIYRAHETWEGAIQALDLMYLSDQPESLPALGQAIWLAVTFPVDPELTVAMLEHVVEETPPDSDGAAVAATVAHYVADMRAEGKERENLLFYTNQLLATVARRHSEVREQADFDRWFRKLELHDPALFMPRLRNVVDVMVQDEWWIDRDAIHAKLPVN
jgi:hypothetical protein